MYLLTVTHGGTAFFPCPSPLPQCQPGSWTWWLGLHIIMDFEMTLKMEAPVLRMLEQRDRSVDPWWPYGATVTTAVMLLNYVRLFMTPWTVVHQAPLTMGEEQKYWSGLSCHPPGDLLDPGIEPESPVSPALAGRFFYHWVTRVELLILGLHYCEEVINFHLA